MNRVFSRTVRGLSLLLTVVVVLFFPLVAYDRTGNKLWLVPLWVTIACAVLWVGYLIGDVGKDETPKRK
jgi:hypothetical protein